MKTVKLNTPIGKSIILIGERLENIKKYLTVNMPIIITDTNVQKHWGHCFPPGAVITIATGEGIKTLDTLSALYEKLLELDAHRGSFVVGIGGGIVCDIAGFAASTYMRGIRFGFVSTTLLSQVDASVGGKNGVNFGGYKNIVGVFSQPEFVICDQNLLQTLPPREFRCGFAEIVKHGAIADDHLFEYLEQNWARALEQDPEVIEKVVHDSVIIKSTIVNKDATEQGERRKLNFGHTLGHAIEKVLQVPHGEAVSAGMVLASKLSEQKGYLKIEDTTRLSRLLENFKLPIRLEFDRQKVLEAIGKDKKREGDSLKFVLLKKIGEAVVNRISIQEIAGLMDSD
ncbi:MAG: 3-dehydroquinate synthase [Desulfobacteraceae bacterium]|jgi:3-dehydroquinate synthase|nr:3-dehydroquinate synthase [Desulfobacteraceae bacterium]